MTIPLKNAFSTRVPRKYRDKHINFKKMAAVLHSLQCWGKTWHGARVHIYNDNTIVVNGLTRETMKGATMDPLRKITLLSAKEDIEMIVHWIPTGEITLADALSWFEFKKLFRLQTPKSHMTHQSHGTTTFQTSRDEQPDTSGGDSQQPPDEHTIPRDGNMHSFAPSPVPTPSPQLQ
ncbi:hypothetical protein BDZ91DRAFT_727522 [Kalaharituber pfeilii]|nr:hypothetical protein BDZ91DRAFT_727522 [Kalaharituber pfeilii]